jgi:hypothetical protein
MQDEQVKTWFQRGQSPRRKGVYLTRSTYGGNRTLTWWRAFDGENWHAGIMAMTPQGDVENVAPKYSDAKKGAVIGDHVSIEWCGVSK